MSGRFRIETERPEQAIDVTPHVRALIGESGIEHGIAQVMVLHSTAAIVINETHDPGIGQDVIDGLCAIIPRSNDWLHDRNDGNAHSHVKASLLGPSELIPIHDGEPVLGTWQGVWLFEFDGPRTREVVVHVVAESRQRRE